MTETHAVHRRPSDAGRFGCFVVRPRTWAVMQCAVLVVFLQNALTASAQAGLETYQTKYYIIYTDLDIDGVREATVRITAMAEEYYERTRGFAGKITDRLEFYLYRNPADYYANGGLPRSSGVYKGKKLMAIVGHRAGPEAWSTIQHEGFHQFADAVMGGDIPIWVEEGLAGYFEESVFTGDGYTSGVIPQHRLERIKQFINGRRLKTFPQLMTLERVTWNEQMTTENYDQAWSMVHFLAHGDGGKYQKAFAAFVTDVARWQRWQVAWQKHFGTDIKAFEGAWRKFWTELPDNPTQDLYTQAVVRTLTGFLGRAHSRKQHFESAEEFFSAAEAGKLTFHPEDWLPPSLLTDALAKATRLGEWSLETAPLPKGPKLILTTKDDKRLVGTFTAGRSGRIGEVTVDNGSGSARDAGAKPARRGTTRVPPTRRRP